MKIAIFMFNCNKTLTPTPFSNFFQKPIKYQTEAQDYRRNRIISIFLNIVIIDYNGYKIPGSQNLESYTKRNKRATYNIFKNNYKKYLLSFYENKTVYLQFFR